MCGILSILFAVTCVGFPVALILGNVALAKQGAALGLAHETPGTYRMPTSGAQALAIIGLVAGLAIPAIGIGAAVLIPAFSRTRDLARSRMLQSNIQAAKTEAEFLVAQAGTLSADQIAHSLLADSLLARLKNPYDPEAPAMEIAQIPSRNGTIALWPVQDTDSQIQSRLLPMANYTENGESKQFIEEVVATSEDPETLPPLEPSAVTNP